MEHQLRYIHVFVGGWARNKNENSETLSFRVSREGKFPRSIRMMSCLEQLAPIKTHSLSWADDRTSKIVGLALNERKTIFFFATLKSNP